MNDGPACDHLAVLEDLQPIRRYPARATHPHVNRDRVATDRGKIAGPVLTVHPGLGQQPHAHERVAREKIGARRIHVDSVWRPGGTLNVSASLSDDEAIYVMAVARADSNDSLAPIEQREPDPERRHEIRLEGR